MKMLSAILLVFASFAVMAMSAAANDRIYVYPAAGQSEQQQSEDRYHCHRWAVDAAGFDPMKIKGADEIEYVRVPMPENPHRGATSKGLLGGAVAGAAIGGIDSHNPGRGAAIGALVGALLGSIVEHQGERQSLEKAQRHASGIYEDRRELAIGRASYQRALAACLEGRGYRVH